MNSLIGMKRCYPVVLASAGIFWWRQICVRERTRRIFDRIFTSFHRRHSLRSTIAVWCGAVGHSRIRTSACSAVERKVEQYHEGIKEMVVWGWASLCSEKGFSRSLRAFRAGDWRPLSAHGTLCFQLVDAVTASQRGRIDRVLLSRRRSRMATLALKNWQSFIHTQMVLKQGLSRGKMRSRKGRKSLLFKEWANVQHYGHSLRVLLRKVAMQKSRCVMSKAFRCLVPSQPNAALVRLPRFGYNRLNKSNYFVAWSLWASEQRRVCKIQKRQRTQAQRRATLSLCSKMLTRWSHFTRAMCETIEQLRRFVRKWIQRKLSCCLFQWQDDLCRRRTILEKSARKMQHYAQGRAWLTWRDVVKIFRTQRRMLVKGFQKMKRRVEKSAWLTWQNHFKLARRQRYCLQKMSRKWRTCLVYRALMNWESSAKEMRRQWRIMHIILLRLQNMTLYKVWYTWRNNVIELCRQQSVLSKMAARIKNVTLMKAWRTWTPLLEKSSESWCKLQHLVRLTDHGCVRRHFRSWLQVVLCSGAEAIAPQKQQCDHLRMLVVSMQGRRRKRAIFNQWWILLKRSHTLNGIAATIAAKSRGYVLWKCLSMWIHAREHTRQQTARISEESMSVRIRMLTNRRLEHIAARTLRLHLRDYLRAWQDGTGRNSKKVSSTVIVYRKYVRALILENFSQASTYTSPLDFNERLASLCSSVFRTGQILYSAVE